MSDELKTGEQALAEGRGKIELPEPVTVIEGVEMAAVAPEPIEDADNRALGNAGRETLQQVLTSNRSKKELFEYIKPEDFFPEGVKTLAAVHDEVIVEAKPKKNILGTQDFCPMKHLCNHRSADYCKQAKLEADHRRDCIKGNKCDCFHPARGIPSGFRVGGGDGRVS
jgi:hypothetical protein